MRETWFSKLQTIISPDYSIKILHYFDINIDEIVLTLFKNKTWCFGSKKKIGRISIEIDNISVNIQDRFYTICIENKYIEDAEKIEQLLNKDCSLAKILGICIVSTC